MKYSTTIGWLYPDLMSTYGDRGNIQVLKKRCEWRGIEAKVLRIEQDTPLEEVKKVDLIFGGGSQDKAQSLVMKDLKAQKGKIIKNLIEKGVPALFVCGSPQLMGKYYEPGLGQKIPGLDIFDMVSVHPGLNKPRLIGNIVAKVEWDNLDRHSGKRSERAHPESGPALPAGRQARLTDENIIVGFENHGGRTYLGKKAKPFAKVIKGFGNNGEDGTEGVVYKNAIGCYFHGPLLPKNPEIADYLIQKVLEVKYNTKVNLKVLDDSLSKKAKQALFARFGIS